jgi:hypothetical protein
VRQGDGFVYTRGAIPWRVWPAVWLPVIFWAGPYAVDPWMEGAVWQDAQPMDDPDQWAETDFDVDGPGSDLVLDVTGQVALDWAEIVFADGTTQVVDFKNTTVESGTYSLLDWRESRRVDHIRMMARPVAAGSSVGVRLME